MSVVVRSRNGGCVPLEPDERHGSVPATVRDKAGRPADLDLYAKALAMGWPIAPDVKADTVARLHDVVRYVNDPRAVTKAALALIAADGVNVKAANLAIAIVEKAREIRDLASDPEPDRPVHIKSRAIDAARDAWDDARALGLSEPERDRAAIDAWTATWEAAGFRAPDPTWTEEA